MVYFGNIMNVATILIGGALGLALKKVLHSRITDTVMQGIGLAVIIIGISGALGAAFTVADGRVSSEHILFMIIALAIGALIGELLKIEGRLEALGQFCERKAAEIWGKRADHKNNNGASGEKQAFAQGFVTATLVFCVGSMAIVGALEEGINGNSDILLAKSALDGISAMIFASTMGASVLLSAVALGIYQGTITLLAAFVAPYFNDVVITQMSLVGSVLIMSIGLNLLRIAKIKVGNLLPSVFIPIIYHVGYSLIMKMF